MIESVAIAGAILGAAWWGWAIENCVGLPNAVDEALDNLSIRTRLMMVERGLVPAPDPCEMCQVIAAAAADLAVALEEMSAATRSVVAAAVTACESAYRKFDEHERRVLGGSR